MNSRGAAAPNDTALCAHAGEIEDLDAVIQALRQRDRHGPLIAMGVSLGGSRVLNWLARADDGSLSAAVAVCSPLRLDLCANRMDQGHVADLPAPSDHQSAGHAETAAAAPGAGRPGPGRAAGGAQPARHPPATFDERVIAPLYGFRGAAHYYAEASAGPRLGRSAPRP